MTAMTSEPPAHESRAQMSDVFEERRSRDSRAIVRHSALRVCG